MEFDRIKAAADRFVAAPKHVFMDKADCKAQKELLR